MESELLLFLKSCFSRFLTFQSGIVWEGITWDIAFLFVWVTAELSCLPKHLRNSWVLLLVLRFESKGTWGNKVTLKCIWSRHLLSFHLLQLYIVDLCGTTMGKIIFYNLSSLHMGGYGNSYIHHSLLLGSQCDTKHKIGKVGMEVSVLQTSLTVKPLSVTWHLYSFWDNRHSNLEKWNEAKLLLCCSLVLEFLGWR